MLEFFLSFVLVILLLCGVLVVLTLLGELYVWIRKTLNRPLLGIDKLSLRLLKRGDYVCIGDEVKCFSHFTQDGEIINPMYPPFNENKTNKGELAFEVKDGLGCVIYRNPKSVLSNCRFVYGKYGLKWALTEYYADIAKNKVDKYIYD